MGQMKDFSQPKPKDDCQCNGLGVRENFKGTKEKEPVDHTESQERAIQGVRAVVHGEGDLAKAVYKLGKVAYTNSSSYRELYISFVFEINSVPTLTLRTTCPIEKPLSRDSHFVAQCASSGRLEEPIGGLKAI